MPTSMRDSTFSLAASRYGHLDREEAAAGGAAAQVLIATFGDEHTLEVPSTMSFSILEIQSRTFHRFRSDTSPRRGSCDRGSGGPDSNALRLRRSGTVRRGDCLR